MDRETIRRQTQALQNILKDAGERLREVQSNCDHSEGSGTYHGNTGNWCPQDDSYWINFECSICSKRLFVENQQSPTTAETLDATRRVDDATVAIRSAINNLVNELVRGLS